MFNKWKDRAYEVLKEKRALEERVSLLEQELEEYKETTLRIHGLSMCRRVIDLKSEADKKGIESPVLHLPPEEWRLLRSALIPHLEIELLEEDYKDVFMLFGMDVRLTSDNMRVE